MTAHADAQARMARYDRWVAVPLLIVALAWTVALILRLSPELRPVYNDQARDIMNIAYVLFVIDLGVRFSIYRSLGPFLRSSWKEIVALVIPVLRLALVAVLIRDLSKDRTRLAEQVFLFSALATAAVVVLGAAVTLFYEAADPKANIDSYGDAVWWAVTTVVTVGYGDFVPVTIPGRVVATLVMIAGAAVVSSLTAAIASRWVGRNRRTSKADSDDADHIAELKAEISRLSGLIEQRFDAKPSPTSPTSDMRAAE